MIEEYARCARHSEDIGICSLKIGGTLVVVAIRVVVVNEGDGITLVGSVGGKTAARETAPLPLADGIVDIILQGEVEGGTLDYAIHLCAVNPVFD